MATMMIFIFAIVFRFGAFLVTLPDDHVLHEEFIDILTVSIVIIFGTFTIGEASAIAPNYAKAKVSANRIFFLLDRQPVIDNYSEDGEKLVSSNCIVGVTVVDYTVQLGCV